MTTDITIPAAALEAGARAAMLAIIHEVEPDARANDLTPEEYASIARAAALALLENWPGGGLHVPVGVGEPRKSFTLPALILPLTEKQYDKA